MKVGSLFAGIGGFDLGLERAGFDIAWQVEIDPYCQRVLAKHWPDVPRYGDIRAIDWATVEPVDLLCGGFPCQDVSRASSRRAGITGQRSGLWTEYLRAICALRPRFVLVENVPGLLDDGMGTVLSGLAGSGYDAEWQVLSAAGIGALHLRQRVWIIAYPSELQWDRRGGGISWWEREPQEALSDFRRRNRETTWLPENQPGMVGMVHGLSNQVDRLRGLGNAIVPQIAEWIGRQIMREVQP